MKKWLGRVSMAAFLLTLVLLATHGAVLYPQESQVFGEVAKNLRGAREVDVPALRRTLDPLLVRLQQNKITSAIPPLQEAIQSLVKPNPAELYKNIMTSWYFTDPESSLNYLFTNVSEGMSGMQKGQKWDKTLTYVDYQLLLGFLSVLIKVGDKKVVSLVLDDLGNRILWFNDANRRDFDYFVMSLELDWLKTILLTRTKNLTNLLYSVDFAVSLQEKTMALRETYAKEPDFNSTYKLLNLMQGQLAVQLLRGLVTLKPQGPRTRGAIRFVEGVVKAVLSQKRDPETMQKMLQDLKSASSLLHSL